MNIVTTQFLFWVTEKRWLWLTAGVVGVLALFPAPEGLSPAGHKTLLVCAAVALLIVFEPIPIPAIAFLILILQAALGIASPAEVADSFMNDAVFFVMGALMLSVAMMHQGLDARLALGILRLTGNKTWAIALGLTGISAFLSSLLGEHTVAAMLLPVALTLIRHTSPDPSAVRRLTALLLFSIAYGVSLGSVGTPSGGGRNVIIIEYWREFGFEPLSYLEWAVLGYPLVILRIPLAAMVLFWTFPPEKKLLDTGVRKLLVQVGRAGPMTPRGGLSLVLFAAVLAGWLTLSGRFGLGMTSLVGVVLFLAAGLVEWPVLNRNTNWGVILLFGAVMSLGIALKETGAAGWLAEQLLKGMGALFPRGSAAGEAGVVVVSAAICNFLSGAGAAAMVGPMAMHMGSDPIVQGMLTAIGAGFGYFTAVAAPGAMIVYSSGLLDKKDFVRAGWRMTLISLAAMAAVRMLWWPRVLG